MNDAPTPRTDEVLRNNACSEQTPSEDYQTLAVHAEQLERELGSPTDSPDANTTAHARSNWWKQRCDDLNEQLAAGVRGAELIARMLSDERALADRLAALLQRDRDGYSGQVVDPECDCCDCEYLRPIDEALAAWKASRDPNNLEGAGPTEEERRENARAIQAMSEQERFDLMFHGPNKEQS